MNVSAIRARADAEAVAVMVRRMRLGAGLWIAAVILVSVAELLAPEPPPALVGLVRVLGLLSLVVVAIATRPRTRAQAVATSMLSVTIVCTTIALVSIVTGKALERYYIFVALTFGTAALFPWGSRPQSLAASIAALAYIGSVLASAGAVLDLADLFQIAVVVAGSVYTARELEVQRVAAVQGRVQLEAGEQAVAQEAQVSAALATIGQELIQSLGTADLLEKVTRLTAVAAGAETSHTFMLDPHDDSFVAVAGHGSTPEEWESLQVLRIPRTAVDRLLSELDRQAVAEVDFAEPEPPIPLALATPYGIKTAVAVALRRGQELIGVLTAGHRVARRLTPPQARLLRGVGHMASLALENSRLFEELQTASQLKSEFVATMSHELRTPLNIILGYGSLLIDGEFGKLNEEQLHILRLLDQNARQLLDLINATLDLSRLESGRLPIDVTEVDVAAVVREVESELRPVAEEKLSVSFVPAIASDVGPLQTDLGKLKLILKNLIGNAYKYTDAGAITVRIEPAGGLVRFEVADTGVGIAPDALPHIFEPFRQGSSGLSRTHGGVGLGLYIVARLLDLLGGSITVDSAVGKGTTFEFCLPRRFDGRGRAGPTVPSVPALAPGPPPQGGL